MLKALRYRLHPTKAQASRLAWTLETCRQVYNSLLNDRKFQYEINGKAPTWLEQKRSITAWKPNHPELSGVHSQVLQDVSKRVELAFQAFFRRIKAGETPGYPRIKGDGYDSFTYPQTALGSSRANSACPRLATFLFVCTARLTAQSRPVRFGASTQNGSLASRQSTNLNSYLRLPKK